MVKILKGKNSMFHRLGQMSFPFECQLSSFLKIRKRTIELRINMMFNAPKIVYCFQLKASKKFLSGKQSLVSSSIFCSFTALPQKHRDIHHTCWNISSEPFDTNTLCHKILCNCNVSFPKDLVDLALHPS